MVEEEEEGEEGETEDDDDDDDEDEEEVKEEEDEEEVYPSNSKATRLARVVKMRNSRKVKSERPMPKSSSERQAMRRGEVLDEEPFKEASADGEAEEEEEVARLTQLGQGALQAPNSLLIGHASYSWLMAHW